MAIHACEISIRVSINAQLPRWINYHPTRSSILEVSPNALQSEFVRVLGQNIYLAQQLTA
jgi:hypothetical protein